MDENQKSQTNEMDEETGLAGTLDPESNETTEIGASVSGAELEELRARAAKADEHWDRLLRQTAEFENFRKRMAREKQDASKFANESLLRDLIPVLDNFEAALAAAANPQSGSSPEMLETGVNMIHGQLKKLLVDAGVEEIDATGKTFDPNLHEAVSQQETRDFKEGQVMQQLRKGYKLRDRLLRPANVIVARKPA